jgi:hypothetical protein
MFRKLASALVGTAAIAAFATTASAQTSTVQAVAINASKGSSLTVNITSGATQNLTLVDNGMSTGGSAISITTGWDLNPGLVGAVKLVGYFLSSTAALTDGMATPHDISSSLIEGRMTTGTPTSYTAFTQNAVGSVGSAGASLLLFDNAIITGVNQASSRTDNLDIRVNLTGTSVVPSTYAGSLKIQAIAQ